MNIRFQSSRHWNDAEDATILKMRKDGASCKEIAKAIDRTPIAVNTRLNTKHHVYKNVQKEGSAPRRPILCIVKSELSHWYEVGWRVQSFSGDVVILEWPHNKPVKQSASEFVTPLTHASCETITA